MMTALGPCSLHGSQYTLDPNAFISINEVTTVEPCGVEQQRSSAFRKYGLRRQRAGPAIDAAGDVWLSGGQSFVAYEVNSSGSLVSPAGGYPTCVRPPFPPIPTQQCNASFGAGPLAIDGSGNGFIGTANLFVDSHGHLTGTSFRVAELNQSGTIISGRTGYVPTGTTAIAIDGSGNVWTENGVGNSLTELVGVATPVVTPFSLGVKNGTLGSRP
jgi:hypothetical protein